jgi:hypothetical protein
VGVMDACVCKCFMFVCGAVLFLVFALRAIAVSGGPLQFSYTSDVLSNAVDLYNSTTGTWSTARLSVARYGLAAASVGNVAIFAGGYPDSVLLLIEGELWE